jgi:hypothetical protein
MTTNNTGPLWSDQRIADFVNAQYDASEYFEVLGAMMIVRNDYEQRLQQQSAEIAELKETIEFARGYIGIEGRACPLCAYDNGVLVQVCAMHQRIDRLRAELAQRGRWEPVADNFRWREHVDGNRVQVDWWKGHLIVGISGQAKGVVLPDHLRLCRRVEEARDTQRPAAEGQHE